MTIDPETVVLLYELIGWPLIEELLRRRGLHGVTQGQIEDLAKNPRKITTALMIKPHIQEQVVTDLADAVDNVFAEAVNAFATAFKAVYGFAEVDA